MFPYPLLSLYTGAALRSSTPAICRFSPLWMEKSYPLRTAHIVPVQKGPLLELILFFHVTITGRKTIWFYISSRLNKKETCLFAQTMEQNLLEPLNV